MSERRQDRTTGNWVVVAPGRGRRPHTWATHDGPVQESAPRFDPACPFCPGHESELPEILAETQAQTPPGWSVRVIPNKFPILQPQAPLAVSVTADHVAHAGLGVHEVIIESPRHDADLASLDDVEIEVVAAAYLGRLQHLMQQPDIEAALLFRNHGRASGASLQHPHTQVIALPFVPPRLASMAEWGARYHGERGRCPTCDELAFECEAAQRIIGESPHFIALVPFAAEHPCEIWIVPKRHHASFTTIEPAELGDFARLLRRTLRRLRTVHDDPPYNFVIDSAPRSERDAPHFHWRLRIAPDLATWGGFELGTGIAVNPSSPEGDAALLRAASDVE